MSYFEEIYQKYGVIGVDAGGRTRVSQLTTLFDGKILNYDNTLLWENLGTGTGAFDNNKYNMSVTSGQWRLKRSRRIFPYASGKSQIVELTFDKYAPQANVTKTAGYFTSGSTSPFATDRDGIYIENDGVDIHLVCERSGTKTLDLPISQWAGYDNLAEYKTLSTWDNFTVCIIDFLWLGGAVARLFVRTSKGFVLAHQFDYPGTEQDTFIKSPNQEVRYEIRSSTGSGEFRYICCQVATEGSIEESGKARHVDTGSSLLSLASIGTTYPVLSLRKIQGYRDIAVLFDHVDIMVGSNNDQLVWDVEINPTMSAPLTYTDVSLSPVQYARGNGTVTVSSRGISIIGGPAVYGATPDTNKLKQNFLAWLGGTAANVMDEYVLTCTPITATTTIFACVGYSEY